MKFNLINLSLISVAISTVSCGVAFQVNVRRNIVDQTCIITTENSKSFYKLLDPNNELDFKFTKKFNTIPQRRDFEQIKNKEYYEIYGTTEKGVYAFIGTICNKISYYSLVGKNPVYPDYFSINPVAEKSVKTIKPEIINDAPRM